MPEDPPVIDPNPRGNSRGGRGIVVLDNAILVANYHTIEVCDRLLNPIGRISNGNFAGIHEIAKRGDRLFVASTANNTAVVLSMTEVERSLKGGPHAKLLVSPQFWWPTEQPAVCSVLKIPQTIYHNKQNDNRLRYLDLHNRGKAGHLHLNAIDADGDRVYALLNKLGAILNLNEMKVVLRHPWLEGAHNLEFVGPQLAYVVSTKHGLLLECELTQEKVQPLIDLNATPFAKGLTNERRLGRWLRFFGQVREERSVPTARSLFWRGLAMNDDWIFIGTSPASILGFNRTTLAYQGVIQLSENISEGIHGIAIDT